MADQTTNKYITVEYSLYAPMESSKETELIEQTQEGHPFVFISGMGMCLDAFEQKIAGLQKGEEFKFSLSPEDAYGEYFAEAVQKLPRNVFEIDGKLNTKYVYEGAVVPLTSPDGERFNGTVTEITDSTVTVDLNHPLAGKELTFEGKVTESREATTQEIEQFAKMMSGEGCGGCGGGNCEGGCGSCGDGGCGGGNCGGGCGGCK